MAQPKLQAGIYEIGAEEAARLQSRMRGRVLTRASAEYESARNVFNGMIDRRPAVIVRCLGVADVMQALLFGREKALPISIRCGGHSLAGFGVCEHGMMIDLEEMTAVTVDPATRSVAAQGGANWGQFDRETQAFGLATTGGLVRSTGIAGLTLAGGHGFLMRRFGLACDNLLSATVLTADGELIKTSAEQHPDLFWALKGGGGNFGVVTEFNYRLHEVGPVLGGLLLVPFAEAGAMLKFYDEFTADAPDELGTLSVLATLPDGSKASVSLVCYAGDLNAGEAALKPLRTFTTPMADQIQAMPYTAVQSIVENFNPRGMRNYWKMVYVRELSRDAIARLMELYSRVPAPMTHIVIYTLGGAVSRVPAESAAVSYRDVRHAVIAIGMWDNPAEDDINIRWVREFADAMQPFSSGGFYPNYEDAAPADRLIAAFGPEKYQRLAAVKQKYDPANVFRLNQNIKPAGE
jgi:FAD/FMN-containing dehydrogenase